MELTDREIGLVEELTKIMVEEYKLKEEDAKKQVERTITEKMFGPGIPSKRPSIGWGSMFSKSQCPVCGQKIEKAGKEYVCGKCGLKMGEETYEKAREQHINESKLLEREYALRERMDEMNVPKEKVDEIYDIAIERSEAEKARMENKGDET